MKAGTGRAGARAAGALLAALLASGALQAQEAYDTSPAAKAALEQLRTDDVAQQKARWGAFAELAGKAYLVQDLGSYEVMWRELEWIVPGAVMRFGNGMCRSGECHHADYTAQYNDEEKRIDFYYANDRKLAGQVRPDGVLAIRYGFMGFENVGIAGGAYKTDSYALEPTTQTRLLALSKGKAGNRQAAAQEAAATQAPAAEAPSTPAVQDALAATGLPLAELRSRFGGLLDVLDRRFMDVDGQDVSWRAFEWLQPGVSIRMWVVGCGNFGCGEPYQVHLLPSGTHGVLEHYDTYERSTRYLFVEPDGALRLQSTRNGLVLGRWRATAGGNLSLYGRSYRAVDAESLARATQGRSRGVALAADNPRPPKAAPQPAPVANAAPAAAAGIAAAPPRATAAAPAAGDLRSQLASMQAQMAVLASKIEEQEKAAAPATSAAPAGRPAPEAAVARPAPAVAAPAGKPGGAAARCGVTEGLYAAAGDGYQVHVRFEGDALVVKETNRTSPYAHLGHCRFGFTAPSGTVFRLMATKRGLIAYREGRDPESTGTLLTLRRPAAAPSALTPACKAQELVPHNPAALNPDPVKKLYGIRQIPGEGARLTGTYKAPERDGHPQTELRDDGSGRFEVYGAPAAEHVYGIRQWWIESNCDGTPIAENHAAGSRYRLVYELDRPYQGRRWQRNGLIILRNENRMLVIDRQKTKE